MDLQSAIKLFLGEYKPTTAASYRYPLLNMQAFIKPTRPLHEIRPADLVAYMQEVRGRDSVRSPATINKYVKTIKRFFNWCVSLDLIEESPARTALKQRSAKKAIGRDKAIPDKELEKLLQYAEFHPRTYALVMFLADTGCRRGGAAGLRWEDVKTDELRAVVTEKGDKTRPVFFGPIAAKALAAWQLKQPAGDGYVFSLDGKKISSPAVSQVVRRACVAAGIQSRGPHSLRHRKGHQLADDKVAPSISAAMLGHSSVDTTLTYYYPHDYDRVEKVARALAIKPYEPKIVKLETRRKKG